MGLSSAINTSTARVPVRLLASDVRLWFKAESPLFSDTDRALFMSPGEAYEKLVPLSVPEHLSSESSPEAM